MKLVFVLLSVVSVLSGILSVFMGLSHWNLPLFVSGVLAIINGYAWLLVNEMSEEIESNRIQLVALTNERETKE